MASLIVKKTEKLYVTRKKKFVRIGPSGVGRNELLMWHEPIN